jgi:flavin-dependent dehydrogenase
MALSLPPLRLAHQAAPVSPALVIGGGLAGASLAIQLAQAGREVLLLEKEAGPHDKVCGEFLSYEAIDALRRLEVDPRSLGAVPVTRVAVIAGRRIIVSDLPFEALSLSRRVLDEAMLQRAADAGVSVRRPTRVTAISALGAIWRVSAADGLRIESSQVFLATGKHDIRGLRRPIGLQSDLIGFKIHLRLTPAMADTLNSVVELHLFPGGYAGLEMIEGSLANLCLVVRRNRFSALGGTWADLYRAVLRSCPHLQTRLQDNAQVSPRPLAIAAIPYGHVQRRADGLWRLGDQAAVIPSFAGEGMAIALHSADLAARYSLEGRSPQAFQTALSAQVATQVGFATLVSRALVRPHAQALTIAALALAPRLLTRVAQGTRLRAYKRKPAFLQ